jgi:ferredoxin-NADP reductase
MWTGEPLLDALISKVPVDRLHYERFSAVDRTDDAVIEAFEVTLSRSNKTISVGKDESLT